MRNADGTVALYGSNGTRRGDRMRGNRCAGMRRLLLWGFVILAPAFATTAGGGERPKPKKVDLSKHVKTLKDGETSDASRKTAEALLAGAKMSAADRRRVNAVLQETSYFRELPSLRFETDPRTYLYLTSRPDVTVAMWRAMKISKFLVKQTGSHDFVCSTDDGTKGNIELVHRSAGHHVILCEGVLKTPLLFRGVQTRSVIHMQTVFTRDKAGKTFATHRAFVHVSFPSSTVEKVAKLLSPVANIILDRNFREISMFVHVMSKAMSRQPGWVERIARKMDDVPLGKKKDLLRVTARVYFAARKRETVPLFKSKQEYYEELVKPLRTASGDAGGRRE